MLMKLNHMKNIKYTLAADSWDELEKKAIYEVIESNKYTMGEKVKKFEHEFAEYFNSPYSVMVNSGSSANLLILSCLKYSKEFELKEGDEFIVPAVSWGTTYFPVTQLGFKLVFVDIDNETLNLNENKLVEAITENTKGIFAVNLLGNPCNFEKLNNICDAYNLLLIEDNCESLGAKFNNQFTGTFGISGSFSFFFSHHMQTMEGGMILLKDKHLYELSLSMRSHGWTRDLPKNNTISNKSGKFIEDSFNFVMPGYNIRPLEMSGAIGSVQLKKVASFIKNRKKNAELFKSLFSDNENIALQKEIGESSWFGFSIVFKNKLEGHRDKFTNKLMNNNIECRPIVAGDFTKNPVIKLLNHRISGNLDNAKNIDKNGFFVSNDFRDLKNEITFLREILEEYESNL
tara:strand:+ start:319 stop:1524 length:1206 start_codon:yes stop_codon:yes gene_type:complete